MLHKHDYCKHIDNCGEPDAPECMKCWATAMNDLYKYAEENGIDKCELLSI